MSGLITPGLGTSEAEWAAWDLLGRLPVLDTAGCRRAVVVAPHPDDETLAVGGLLAVLLAQDAEVVLVLATDGEGSHPASPTWTPQELREVRAREAERAFAALAGESPGRRVLRRLGLPDGGLAAHVAALVTELGDLLGPDDWCVAPFDGDGHPDHEAGGRAAARACATTGARLLSYPLWAWHWAQPGDPRIPWERASRLLLPRSACAAKERAIACYPSQTQPLGPAPEDAAVVPPSDLVHFLRPEEVVLA